MTFRATTIAALLIALCAPPVAAQLACANRAVVIARLTDDYGEVFRGLGMSGPAALFEMYANPETRTWTFIMTTTDGRTCIMAAGENWRDAPPTKQGDET